MKPISKRLFSLLLAVIVVLGLPFTAMAATEPDSSQASGDLPLEWQIISDNLPDPILGYDPHDPDNPYLYGVPVDTFYPIEEIDPYAVAPAALDQSCIPEEMRDNAILRALEYTGYDVQYLKKNGYLYVRQYIGSSLKTNAPQVLSDIGYWSTGACPNGDETVADSSTVTGRSPKLSYFESNGLVCASFVTYYLCNYLPNIEGVDTSAIYEKAKEMGADTSNSSLYYLTTVTTWKRTLDALASESGSGVSKYTDDTKAYKNLVPGDVIVFASEGTMKHIAIYAGACDFYSTNGSNSGERHFIIHVGNSRGPEINTVEAMGSAGAKECEPIAWYHIDLPKEPTSGYIEVNKKDPDGKKLSGAAFTAVNQSTKESFVIGPINASGYAKSGELPLGTYVVMETVFPAGYEASGQSNWTVTLTEDTPNMTITINAVNKQTKGTVRIVKATTNGGTKAGWHFEVKNSGGTVVGTYVTDASGVIAVDLVPGTYTVTETDGVRKYWVNDPNPSRTVTVKANETASVTFTNQWRGQAQIVKTATNGGTVAGWHFEVTDSSGTIIGNYVTDSCGIIALDLEPGTYTVTEVEGENPYWQNDPTPSKTVTVKAGETAKVTFTNKYLGRAQIIKTATNGGTVAGWHFEVKDSSGIYGYRISVVDLREPTRSDGNNLLTLINRYMDKHRDNPRDIGAKAKAEKYAKILAKTIINPEGDNTDRGQNAYFYDSAEGLLASVVLLLSEFLPPEAAGGYELRHIASVFKLVQELLMESSSRREGNQFQELMQLLPADHKAKVLVKECGLESKIMSSYSENGQMSTKSLPPGGRWPSAARSEEERRNLKVRKMPEI